MEFKLADGMTSASKVASSDMLTAMFQTVQAVPQLQQEYPLGSIFATMMRAGGVDIAEHRYSEEEIQYNQQLAAWQQAAMAAAQANTEFSVPMPQPPGQQPAPSNSSNLPLN